MQIQTEKFIERINCADERKCQRNFFIMWISTKPTLYQIQLNKNMSYLSQKKQEFSPSTQLKRKRLYRIKLIVDFYPLDFMFDLINLCFWNL